VEKKRTFASMNISSKAKTTKENTWIANQNDEESSKKQRELITIDYTEEEKRKFAAISAQKHVEEDEGGDYIYIYVYIFMSMYMYMCSHV
jgi:hypothetical protein